MHDRYGPPTDPVPWPAHQPERMPDREAATQRWYPDSPARYDEPAGEARSQGLRRLSKLTWRATQLSAVAAVGFAALFAHTAHSYASHPAATVRPTAKPTVSPTPSPSATHKHHHHHHHHHHGAAAAAASPATGGAAPSSAAAAAPSPTLAPPTTAPAPSPTPTPTQTSSGGSQGGG